MRKSNQLITELNDSSGMSTVANGLGYLFYMAGELDSAKVYYYRSFELGTVDPAPGYAALSRIYLDEKNLDSARICINKTDTKTLNSYTRVGRLKVLSNIEEADNNLAKALDWLKKYEDAADSLYDEEYEINVANVEDQYNHETEILADSSTPTRCSAGIRSTTERKTSEYCVYPCRRFGLWRLELLWTGEVRDAEHRQARSRRNAFHTVLFGNDGKRSFPLLPAYRHDLRKRTGCFEMQQESHHRAVARHSYAIRSAYR